MLKNIKVGSFFAGVGGICLGFEQAGAQMVFANEIDIDACNTYKQNFPHALIQGDIEKILHPQLVFEDKGITKKEMFELEDEPLIQEYNEYKTKNNELMKEQIDILTAGFPCQPFSIAGAQKGFADERGNLFHSVIEYTLLAKNKPSVLFLENVKNLVAHDDGHTFTVIKSLLRKAGYIVKHSVLNTTEYTKLPQNRERIFMVCFLSKEHADKFDMFENLDEYKIIKTKDTLRKEIDNILDIDKPDPKYEYTKEKYPNYFVTDVEYHNLGEERKAYRINLSESINEEYEFYQVRRGMYVRKNAKGICPTLTANMGTGGHNVPLIFRNGRIRKLTEKECFKMQGFPIGKGYNLPDYKGEKKIAISKYYKQAGNAVSVDIIEMMAKNIIKAIR